MAATYAQTPPELVFPPQAAFSWTLRWARAHEPDGARTGRGTHRSAGSTPGTPLAVIAFAREHDARLELD